MAGLMCLDQINIPWDRRLYECDFNQMLGMTTDERRVTDLRSFDWLVTRQIALDERYCFACTAGAGSS